MNDLLTGFLLTFLTGLLWSFAGGCYKKHYGVFFFSGRKPENILSADLPLSLRGSSAIFLRMQKSSHSEIFTLSPVPVSYTDRGNSRRKV